MMFQDEEDHGAEMSEINLGQKLASSHGRRIMKIMTISPDVG